jgi:N-acetylglutamate synthase-like GNAT family acetyltransferase
MSEVSTSFVKMDSEKFEQAVEIRYDQLFKNKGLPKSVTVDDLDETSLHCIAECEGRVIGYGRLSIDGGKGKISQMAVLKESQGKGVGKSIVLAMIEKAKELKVPHLYMAAREHVIGFYEKLGFHAEGGIFPSKITGIPHKTMVMDL